MVCASRLGVIVVGVIVLLSVLGAAGAAPVDLLFPQTSGDSSPPCEYADVHNAARLEATSSQATNATVVRAGSHLNGTGGSLILQLNGPSVDKVRLEGPDGTEAGPRSPYQGSEVLFHHVPLCATGTWEIVDAEANETIGRFQTTLEADQDRTDTIVLNQTADTTYRHRYHAGSATPLGIAYTGPTLYEAGPAGSAEGVRVSVNWTSDLPVNDIDRAVLTLRAGGEDRNPVSVHELPDDGSGNLSVYPDWAAPSFQDVEVQIWGYDDGELLTRSWAETSVAVAPDAEASSPGSPASLAGTGSGFSLQPEPGELVPGLG